MASLYHRLKSLFGVPYPIPVSWTKEERQAFLLFSRSRTGIKLIEFLKQYASGVTFDAVRHDRAAQCAYARGVQDTVLLFINLARESDVASGTPIDDELELLPSQRERGVPVGGHSAI
jgi:hypothetical protein